MVAIGQDKAVTWLSSQYKFDVISLRKDIMQERKESKTGLDARIPLHWILTGTTLEDGGGLRGL